MPFPPPEGKQTKKKTNKQQDNVYSGFLWVVPTNTGIFLRRKQKLDSAPGIQKEN